MAITAALNPNESITGAPHYFFGLASDTKPTVASHDGLPEPTRGSLFLEYDTDIVSVTYDGTNWVVRDLLVRLVAGSVAIGDVDVTSIAAGTNRIGQVSGTLKEVRVSQVIDGSLGAYTAGDVVGADDCCTTLAVVWTFDVARVAGGYGYITGATLVNETENQAVQYDLLLFNATPTGELRDNAANDNPLKADRSKFIGVVSFPFSVARGATVATYAQASPTTTNSNLPMPFKCAAGVTTILGVLVTNTAYTQTATDDIEITLEIEQF